MADGKFSVLVPLDAADVPDRGGAQKVKVAVMDASGVVQAQVVAVDEKGQGEAAFKFKENPGSLQVVVGPGDADDNELFALQTVKTTVSARQFTLEPALKLPPLKIPPFYWDWWRRWCIRFTIRGRVVCPDGRPVPGAKVCAYDVDWWWWWTGKQQIGCDTTDASGAFSIPVRWCCGWLPWYWWRLRMWALEPSLLDKIRAAVQLSKIPIPLPDPDPIPSIKAIEKLAAVGFDPQPDPPSPVIRAQPGISLPTVALPRLATSPTLAASPKLLLPAKLELPVLQPRPDPNDLPIEPADLDNLRDRLLKFLPDVPELSRLQVWPWFRWHPWWDCAPDIIFSATQRCDGVEKVIISEGFSDARWDVSSNLGVTLVARDACCVEHQQDPPGNCVVLSTACQDLLNNIGGNIGATPTPVGYANPSEASAYSDQPYAETVHIRGQFGTGATVDYYEFEWAPYSAPAPPPAAYSAMPVAASGGFTRTFFGPGLGGAPGLWHDVPFNFQMISGRNVIESREHFEATHDPLTWGVTRFWVANRDMLMSWHTKGVFADGTWSLRVRTWEESGGALTTSHILNQCNTETPNTLALRVDNREVLGGPPPTSPGQPCGSNTVHICTTEPDTDIIEVRVDGRVVGPCGTEKIGPNSVVEIDFLAYDPDGHLHSYELTSHFGDNQVRNALNPAAGTLAAGPAAPPVPSAAQVGPNYFAAVGQGAVRPTWVGGVMRLTITQPLLVFPQTCAYLLRLRAYKRNIVNCNYSLPYRNESTITFTVLV